MKKRTLIITIMLVLVLAAAVLGYQRYRSTPVNTPEPVPAAPAYTETEKVTVMETTIKEANYSGTRPVIGGRGALADAARTYIDESVASFGASADEEVPALRKEFGTDAPPAHYTIDIQAKLIESARTQSIVIDSYVYTGGANGNSTYKVLTATRNGTLLTIADIIKPEMQDEFVSFMKKQLLAYNPDGSTPSPVFPESVKGLALDSFGNFSFTDSEIVFYFDKYQIGPGALGAVAYPLPLSVVQQYIRIP